MTVPVLAQTILLAGSGNPADAVVNDFVFDMATFTSTDADDIAAAIESFYTTVQVIPGTDHAVQDWLTQTLSSTADAHSIKLYDLTGHLDGSPHGSPSFIRQFTLTPGGTGFPSECAVALSYHADLAGVLEVVGATRPRARRRGRVFLGPIIEAGGTYIDSQLYVTESLRDTVAAAATLLMGALGNAWSVWSRQDAVLRQVEGGWVDNAFDVQRRRGPRFTTRTLIPV